MVSSASNRNTIDTRIEMEWLDLTKKGDPQGFSNIVEAYQRPVYNLCYRMLNNAEDAEDAAQEAFLRAYKNINRYDHSRSFGTWLLSIAAHYCIDQIRKRRLAWISLEDMSGVEFADDQPGPEINMTRTEEQKRIQELLDVLSPIDRAAVIMYYWYDLSYEEISDSLKLTTSAVKSRLHRARREMAVASNKICPPSLPLERKRYESPAF